MDTHYFRIRNNRTIKTTGVKRWLTVYGMKQRHHNYRKE